MPYPLLLTGFHRSGTSFVANLLHAGGLDLGERLLGARWSNPHGHFEDEEIVQFHEALLRDMMGQWAVPSGVNGLYAREHQEWIANYQLRRAESDGHFGFKDPRLCLTIRLWAMALGRLDIIYIHRDPRASITSMWRRAWGDFREGRAQQQNSFLVHNVDFIAKMYLDYTHSFLSFVYFNKYTDVKIHFIDYDDVVNARVDMFDVLEERFSRTLQRVDLSHVFDMSAVTAVDNFVETDPVLAQRMDTLDRLVRHLARLDREGNPRSFAPAGETDPHREPVDVEQDATAYRLAAERQRLHRLRRVVHSKEVELQRLQGELGALQRIVDRGA